MITGTLLLNPEKKLSTRRILQYIRRILLVILAFGIPCAMLMTMMELHVKGISREIIQLSFLSVIENTGLGHFWYLYVLIGLYMVLPLLKTFIRNADTVEIGFLMTAMLILDFVFPTLSDMAGIEIAFKLPLTYPCCYLFLGYLLKKNRERLVRYRKIAAVTVFALFSLSWILNAAAASTAKILFRYKSPVIALYAAGIFILFTTRDWKTRECIWHIDRLCFAVYIIHVLFIQFCYRVLKVLPTHSGLYPVETAVFGILFTVCSFLGAWILYRIKPLRKYVL